METIDYRRFLHTPEFVKLKKNGIPYPEYDSYEVVGNIFTSRIYGKDLSVFEVASSGRIAFTVNDFYSLDLSRDNAASNVILATNNFDTLSINSSNAVNFNTNVFKANASNFVVDSPIVQFNNVNDYTMKASNVSFESDTSIKLSSPGAFIQVQPSNVTIRTADELYIQGSNNGYIQFNSNVFVDANSKAFLTLTGDTGTASLRGDEVQILVNTPTVISPAMKFYYDANIGSNVAKIEGNLIITGTFETQNVFNTNLTISDKTIQLAYNDGDAPTQDGSMNDGGGIIIDGVNTSNTSFNMESEQIEFYKKAILWKYNKGGIDFLGTNRGISATTGDLEESYWDVRGGGLQISVCRKDAGNNLDYLSYGFRINEFDQLELYKRFGSSNGVYLTKRVSRWGLGAPVIL